MENTNKKNQNSLVRTVFEWVELVAISITVVMIILNCFARYSPVDGDSMNETLHDKDILILSDLFYTPKNGDIVVFASKKESAEDYTIEDFADMIGTDGVKKTGTGYDVPYVKRVIATAGQVVDYDPVTNEVTVDGEVPEWEQYATYKGSQRSVYASGITYPYTVPEGHIFVMGDNRWNSRDSRDIGPVDVRTVLGRVVFRIYPNTGIVE